LRDSVVNAQTSSNHQDADQPVLPNRISWDKYSVTYIHKLIRYHARAKEFLNTYFPNVYLKYGLPVTGHSLGGALSKYLVMSGNIATNAAVGFNAPGCGNFEHLMTGRYPHVYNVNARYDLVSKVNTPVGNMYWVDVKQKADIAKTLLSRYIERHPFPTHAPDPKAAHPQFGNLHLFNPDLVASAKHAGYCQPIQTGSHAADALAIGVAGVGREAVCVGQTTAYDAAAMLAQHSMDNVMPAVMGTVDVGTRLPI
jgi:hypothetical protein